MLAVTVVAVVTTALLTALLQPKKNWNWTLICMSTASYKIPIYDSFATWSWVLADCAWRLWSESWCLRVAVTCLIFGILSETRLAEFRTLIKCWSRSAFHLLWYLGTSSFCLFLLWFWVETHLVGHFELCGSRLDLREKTNKRTKFSAPVSLGKFR